MQARVTKQQKKRMDKHSFLKMEDGENDYNTSGSGISTLLRTYPYGESYSFVDNRKSADRQRSDTDVGVYRKNKNYRSKGTLLFCLKNIT